MRTSAKWLLVATALVGSTSAMAGDYRDRGYDYRPYRDSYGPYVGLSFGTLQYSEEGLDSISPGLGVLRLGVPLAPNLAIEGRAGGGFGRSSERGYGVQVDSLYAGYLKGSLPLGPMFSFYAVGGVAGVNLKRDFGYVDARDSGLSFGFGADINLGRGAGLNLEWTRLPSGNNAGYDYDTSMATLGVTWHF
jgi:hypothetical protein